MSALSTAYGPQANEAAFELAVEHTADVARTLLRSLVTTAVPRDREAEAAKARTRAAARFGQSRRPADSP